MTASAARVPWRGLLLIWLAAVALNLLGLGHAPLRDWDEALVARVALELSTTPWPQWLLPTQWGEPYLNKPPGVHALIAALITLWRQCSGANPAALPPEWVVRLAPALGASLLSPLLALVQWQLRPGQRRDALWTAVISLTLLPLARHGHLAMLDGVQLSAMATLWLGLLVAKPLRPWRLASGGLLAGLAGSALLLIKAPVAAPVLLVALGLRSLDRDLDRRSWGWLLTGLGLGLLPGLAWHGWHLLWRGDDALVMWGQQGFARLNSSVENHSGGPLPPLIQVLTGGWPWLPLWPLAITRCWQQRREVWGRWCLGLTAMASLMVLPLQTQLPWYSLLLWPPFALCCGPMVTALISGDPGGRWKRSLTVLVSGWFLALALLFQSPLWNWELNEQASILPVLPLLPQPGSNEERLPLALTGPISKRPSLWWYAQTKTRGEGWIANQDRPAFLVITDRSDFQANRQFLFQKGHRSVRLQCQLDQAGSTRWNRWLCSSSESSRSAHPQSS